ncbi:MAG: diaminopimelate epimerase [Deltaproteobacteria bacterium]|nr:diaminopimelate epimerase [Deltaproteobacteria bacterium]
MNFYKLSGSGNDFIVIDNMDGTLDGNDWSFWAKQLCRRRIAVGADGLIVIVPSSVADFKWLFYNADGSSADMCGNGGRCAALFAHTQGIAGKKMSFETGVGIITAEVVDAEVVKIKLTPPHSFREDIPITLGGKTILVNFVNTGVPHAVCFEEALTECDVVGLGRAIRTHETFAPAGTNANFIRVEKGFIHLRTYERGVEDETLACGTGAVASSVVAIRKGLAISPVSVGVRSGEILRVHYEESTSEIYLEGGAVFVYKGEPFEGALR